MHELALAQGIVDIVKDHASRGRFTRTKVVHLELGALSNVLPDALLFGFESVARGTVADGARLEFHHLPGKGWCMDCAADIVVNARVALCPRCQGTTWVVTGGEQMRVLELEVD
jgi:hydrogenase nickel incorporation protein HypA/HybF